MATDVKFRLAVDGGPLVSQTIDGVTKKLEAMGGTAGIAKNMLAGMATGLSVAAFTAYTKAAIDAADAINDLSQRVGISVRELAKYELAAAQSGTTMEALAGGIKGIAGNLAEHGDALKKAGITATTADGAMQQLADVFAAMPDGMEKTTLAVKLFGKSGMDLIPMLNLGSAGLQDAAEKSAAYAEQMALLAPLADAFNDNLATLALASKTAAASIINSMMPAAVEVAGAMAVAAQQTGIMSAAWAGFADVGDRVLSKLSTRFLEFNAWIDESNAKLMRFFGQDSEADKLMNAANERYLKIQRMWGAIGPQTAPSAPVTDTKSVADALTQADKLLAALKEQKSAEDSAAKATKDRLAADEKAYKIHYGLVMAQIQAMNRLVDVRNKDYDSVTEYMAAESLRLVQTANASEAAVRAAQDEYDNHGKLQSAIAETTLVRLQDQLTNKTAGTEAYDSLARQIAAQQQLINILKKGEVRDAAEQGAKDLADANKKAAEESSKYWEDALMRAFESGKGFFESLWDTIKNTLKTQVLKVAVSVGMSGVSALASAATGGASNSIIGSALGSAATSGMAGGVSSLLMSPGMGALDIAGISAGVLGPIALGIGAIAAILGNKKTPSAGTGEGAMTFDALGGVTASGSRYSGSWGLTDEVTRSITALHQTYADTAQALGISTVAAQFAFGGNTGKEGKDPQFALGVNAGGVSYSSGEIQLTDANLALASSRAILAALQGSELPAYLASVFDGLTASTATQEQITAALDYAAQLKNVREALSETREPLQILQDQVSAGTAALATSADTFKTDFIAAIDAGISPAKLAQWQALGTALDQLATNAAETAAAVAAAAARLAADIISAQDSAMSDYMSAQADYASIIAAEQESAAQAMQQAADASTQAAEAIRSAMANAGQGIAALIRDLTTTAGGTLDPMALMRSTQRAYLADLSGAQGGNVEASARIAASARAYLDASGAVSGNNRQAATVAQVVAELGALPAVKTYEQQLLDAVNGISGTVASTGATNTADLKAALSTKLTAELTVTARSEILKLVNFVSNTDRLPDDLRAIALADASTMAKTINFVQGSTLPADVKQLALATAADYIRTYNLIAGSTLSDEVKTQAFAVVTGFDRTVNIITGSLLSDDAKAQAFGAIADATRTVKIIADSPALEAYKATALEATANATKWVALAAQGFSNADASLISAAAAGTTKMVALALGNQDPAALDLLTRQSTAISAIITASGGDLTDEQELLLNGLVQYYKNVSIGVTVDQAGLTAAQSLINSLFGNVNILGNAASGTTGTGGLTVAELLGQAEIDRLASINRYINTLDFSAAGVAASVAALNAAATTFGVSINDIANASGYTVADLQALGVAGVASSSSVTNLGSSSTSAANNVANLGASASGVGGILSTYVPGYTPPPTKYATGGVFTNSIVSSPTAFAMGLMGEAGPEAIMPLRRGADGALGVLARLQSPQANSDALVAEIRRLNATNEALERRLAAIARNTQAGAVHQADSADSLRNLKNNGVQVWTDPAEPLKTEVAA